MLFAEVILPLHLPTNYTYHIPKDMEGLIQVGIRVEVNFGKNKRYAAIIKKIHSNEPPHKTKPILSALDAAPILYEKQLQLWEWMAKYYMCAEGDIMLTALPANFKLTSETILNYNEDFDGDFSHLNDKEFMVAEALLIRKQLTISEVQQITETINVYNLINKLIQKNIAVVWEKLKEKYKPKTENFVSIAADVLQNESLQEAVLNSLNRAPKQLAIVLTLLQQRGKAIAQKKLLELADATPAQLQTLAQKKIVLIHKHIVDRFNFDAELESGEEASKKLNLQTSLTLSNAQQQAFDSLKNQLQQKTVSLLHGITGSGKTEIYIKAIDELLYAGEQALYLLPEIALTAQIIKRLKKHFGDAIAIYHSKFNNNERVELWNKVKNNDVKLVLGARSALLLPFQNLKLIIIDEEHDASFKQQEPAPRYQARDTAIYYASLFQAKVILGSATPSIETYYNAQKKKFGLVTLSERFGASTLPKIEIVSSRSSDKKLPKQIITEPLANAIQEALSKNKQVILLQNRRGYNPFVICNQCGYIPQCTQCDVSLTLHKQNKKMNCHYCGNTYTPVVACPACGNAHWIDSSFGTEKVEETVLESFTKANVVRMDVDTVRGKNAYDQLLGDMEQGDTDILIGTQMVSKGLDFEHVEVVGIIDADSLMSFTDFKINERAFQLMSQVSGRAGRKNAEGKVIIQTGNPQREIFKQVVANDYVDFYEKELLQRNQFHYPPYTRLIGLQIKHKAHTVAEAAAQWLALQLKTGSQMQIKGPAAAVIPRIRNKYIFEILCTVPNNSAYTEWSKQFILQCINAMHAEKQFSGVQVLTDVDPN